MHYDVLKFEAHNNQVDLKLGNHWFIFLYL